MKTPTVKKENVDWSVGVFGGWKYKDDNKPALCQVCGEDEACWMHGRKDSEKAVVVCMECHETHQ